SRQRARAQSWGGRLCDAAPSGGPTSCACPCPRPERQRGGPARPRLSRGSRLEGAAAVNRPNGRGWHFERRPERVVVVQRLEIGISAGQRAVFRIQRDGPLQIGEGLRGFVALRVSDGEHIERMIVLRILVAYEPQVGDGLIVPPAVDGDGRRIEASLTALRRAS